MKLQGRSIAKGTAKGELLITDKPISFLGGVDPKTGIIIDENHPLHGVCIAGKVFVFPFGKGSTVGSYILYALAKNHVAPAAIINEKCETIIAAGAIIGNIPAIDMVEGNLPAAGIVCVNGTDGTVTFE